jgi:nitrite reductase/ring-hydroxylating ferredoxin subunit
MPNRHVICRFEELPEPGARGFSFPGADFPDEWFLVRYADRVYAYRNLCPHAGRFLNWKPDAFLTRDLTMIMCAGHGALFDPQTGKCIAGAALGQELETLSVTIENGMVVVEAPESA